METLEIDIINPKAKKIIQELENLDLISIRTKPAFSALAKKLRQKVAGRISVEDINAIVWTHLSHLKMKAVLIAYLERSPLTS